MASLRKQNVVVKIDKTEFEEMKIELDILIDEARTVVQSAKDAAKELREAAGLANAASARLEAARRQSVIPVRKHG